MFLSRVFNDLIESLLWQSQGMPFCNGDLARGQILLQLCLSLNKPHARDRTRAAGRLR